MKKTQPIAVTARRSLIESLENRTLLSTSTTTALSASTTAPVTGQSVTLTATVSAKTGTPTGTVTFKDGSTVLGTATLNSSKQAAFTTTKLAVGTQSLTAVYGGTSAFSGSTSPAFNETVKADGVVVSITPSVTSSKAGQAVTFKATVAAKAPGSGVPAGTVSFKYGTEILGTVTLSNGVASLSTTALVVGGAYVNAVYNGSTGYTALTSSATKVTVTAAATTTTLTTSNTTAVLGQYVTLTAAVSAVSPGGGVPTGSVGFYNGSTLLGTVALVAGKASTVVSNLFTGSYNLTAKFLGVASYLASTSSAVGLKISLPATSTASDGLQTATVHTGTGRGAVAGDTLDVNYTGFLTNGTVFDSSLNAGRTPFDFTLGAGQVITGWDEGLVGIKVGESRVLIIPPALGYGTTAQNGIPANSTLIFIVNLVKFDLPQVVITGKNSTPVTYNEAPTTSNGTSFGNEKVGSATAASTFTITNAGSAGLNFTATNPVTVTGTNAGDFVITQPAIANNAATFTVTFKPTAKGTRSAVITLLTNDPTHPSFTFTVTGVGI